MELWTRTQDKECITMVHHLYTNDNGEIKQEDDIILGTYKSKERALEVLDEIQEFLERKDYEGNRYYEDSIYEMPKE